MKKLVYLGLLLLVIPMQSQVNKIPEGTYVSTKKGERIKFNIKSDNTFEMSFFTGKISQKNDSILLESESLNSAIFELQKKEGNAGEKLQLTFTKESSLAYYSDYVFIGTQKKDKGPIEYKAISEYLPGIDQYEIKEYTIALDKPKCLYLVHQDQVEKESTLYKFDIDKETNALEIEYNPAGRTDFKLFATYDAASQELRISDGKSPLIFVPDSGSKKENSDNNPKPATIEKVKNWDYPGKKKETVEEDYAAIANAAIEKAPYNFKVKVDKSLSQSLKTLEKQKGKYLVVFVDPSKEAAKNFKEFVTKYENNASLYMYEAYNAEYDKLNFYLATPKEKNIPKNINTKEPHILIYNSKGALLYFEKGINYVDSEIITSGYNIVSELSNANCEALLDYACTSKISIQEKKEILEFVSKNYVAPYTTTVDEVQPAEVVPVEVVPVEAVPAEKEVPTENMLTVDPPSDVYSTAVVDVAPAYEENWGILKQKQNFYKLKSQPETVKNLWATIFNNYKKQPTDMGIAVLGLKELQEQGFMKSIFDQKKSTFEPLDYEILDYLLKNHKAITEKDAAFESIYNSESIYDIRNDLFNLLYTALTDAKYSQETHSKLLVYYKKCLDAFPKEYYSFKKYLDLLKEKKEYQEYFTASQHYFSSILSNNGNVIEQLDQAFTANKNNDSSDWTTYKYNFANLCNEGAWWVVEDKSLQDKSTLEKVIHWSEVSLQIEKNNGYFLDTLAQLYYINGEKQKGITTQENAIKHFIKESDPEVFEQMKETLVKMKNGSY